MLEGGMNTDCRQRTVTDHPIPDTGRLTKDAQRTTKPHHHPVGHETSRSPARHWTVLADWQRAAPTNRAAYCGALAVVVVGAGGDGSAVVLVGSWTSMPAAARRLARPACQASAWRSPSSSLATAAAKAAASSVS